MIRELFKTKQDDQPNEADPQELAQEVADLHKRIALTNLRIAHLEHGLGVRKHTFPQGEQRHTFGGILRAKRGQLKAAA